MNIVVLTDAVGGRGKERRLTSLLKMLSSDLSNEIYFIIFGSNYFYSEIFNMRINIIWIQRDHKYDIKPFLKISRIIKMVKPIIIHSWGTLPTIFSIPSSLIYNIPIIDSHIADASPNNHMKWSKKYIQNIIIEIFSDCVVANSQAGLQVYNVPASKSLCIYNGYDLTRNATHRSKDSLKNKFNIQTKYIVTMIASFCDDKDYSTYFSVAHLLTKLRDDITFLAVGDGPNYLKAKNIYFTEEEHGRIRLLGSRQDVDDIICITDVGVLATFTEGISNAILEYSAQKVPVIATGGGGTLELIEHAVSGYIFQVGDIKKITSKLSELLNSGELRERIGEAAFFKLKSKFNINNMYDQYYKLYRSYS